MLYIYASVILVFISVAVGGVAGVFGLGGGRSSSSLLVAHCSLRYRVLYRLPAWVPQARGWG